MMKCLRKKSIIKPEVHSLKSNEICKYVTNSTSSKQTSDKGGISHLKYFYDISISLMSTRHREYSKQEGL